MRGALGAFGALGSRRTWAALHAGSGLVASALAMALAGPSAATTLGPLTAQSLRDEPLRAVVRIDEAAPGSRPAVRIAPPGLYERLGYPRDPALAGAAVTLSAEPDGTLFARVSTAAPVAADEIVLLVEIQDTSHLRVYRLRLGSAEPAHRVNVRGAEPVARPTGSARDAALAGSPRAAGSAGVGLRDAGDRQAQAGSQSRESAGGDAVGGAAGSAASDVAASDVGASNPAATAAAAGTSGAAVPIVPQGRPDAVEVPPGADLASIARTLRPAGATLEQSAVALLRANRAALAGNPLRPRAGLVLAVPGEATVLALDPAQARDAFGALGSARASPATGSQASAVPASDLRAGAPVRPAVPIRPAVPAVRRDAGQPLTARPPSSSPPPGAADDVDLSSTLDRLRALERRVAALRAGVEASAQQQDAIERAVRAASPRVTATPAAAGTPDVAASRQLP